MSTDTAPPVPATDPPSWKSARSVPISGRYGGEMTSPTAGKSWIEVRIDIDPTDASSPVTDRISGDLYDVNHVSMPGVATNNWRLYRESWIVDKPEVRWSSSSVEIKGTLRYWKSIHPETTVLITVPWAATMLGPAEVTFQETGAPTARFSCDQIANSFRDLALEVAVCKSIEQQPTLPVYNVGSHNNRPTDVQIRTLDLIRAYAEAGVRVSVNPTIHQVDDSAANLDTWTSPELYDALQTYYSQAKGEWPNWAMWGILATTFETPSVGGIMFDTASERGGTGPSPERKGFAIFRRHPWFNDLRDALPTNQSEAAASRQFLYTWVHEAGHAFNFLHSWDKNRPDALSWMNYDWRYDNRNGKDKFWNRFRFRFDDEELIHLRHGDRAAVIMGGDPWGSNGAMFAPPAAEYLRFAPGAMARAEGNPPIEVLIRSKKYFEFLEPVEIELRLRNLLQDYPFAVDTNLDPDYGSVSLFIRRPDGRIAEFSPITCRIAEPVVKKLAPVSTGQESGLDRHSALLHVTYGSPGFYFDNPGEYLIRAVYHGFGDLVIPSNVLRLRIGNPIAKEQDILAQDFFQHDVGLNLAFDGSVSPYLRKGLDLLRTTSDRYPKTILGAKTAIVVANAIGRPFFRIEDDTVRQAHTPDFKTALALSDRAVQVFRSGVSAEQPEAAMNLVYHRISAKRAGLLARFGRITDAQSELQMLRDNLSARGVHQAVLDGISAAESDFDRTPAREISLRGEELQA